MNEQETMEMEAMNEVFEAEVDVMEDEDILTPEIVETDVDEEGNPLADLLLLAGGVVVGVTATVLIPKAVSGCKKGYSFLKGKVNDWKDKKKSEKTEPVTETTATEVAEKPVETEVVEEPAKATPKRKNK